MKVLVGGLVAMIVSVWGIVLVQDNTVEKVSPPATPVAAAPTPHDSRLDSFNAYSPAPDAATLAPRGQRRQLRAPETATLAAGDAPPLMLTPPPNPEAVQKREAERAQRQAFREKWQALAPDQRRTLRKECKAQGLSRHDPECMKLADSVSPSTGDKSANGRRGKAGGRRAQRTGQPAGTD